MSGHIIRSDFDIRLSTARHSHERVLPEHYVEGVGVFLLLYALVVIITMFIGG